MVSPERTALAIPELLERILLQADMRTLLTAAQLVSHAWHDVILQSPSIQEKLFFRPSADTEIRIRNPLLCELFPPWFPPEGTGSLEQYSKDEIEKCLPLGLEGRNESFVREDASWRRMLPRQPPFHSLTRVVFSHGRGHVIKLSSVMQCDGQGRHRGDESESESEPPAASSMEPVRMDAFYNLLISGGRGEAHHWLFIWDHPEYHTEIPAHLGHRDASGAYDVIQGTFRADLEERFKRDEVVMFEWQVPQCCPGSAPWAFSDRFHLTLADRCYPFYQEKHPEKYVEHGNRPLRRE